MKIKNISIFIFLSIITVIWFIYAENQSKKNLESSNLSVPKDADNDGVVDTKDKCPEVAGEITLYGCSDTDGDGVSDSEDLCPYEKGTIENKGCVKIVVPVERPKKVNEQDGTNNLVVISYKGEKYKIKEGFTRKDGMTFNGSNWRYLENLMEKREVSKKVNWKVVSQKEVDFFLLKNAKKIVQKKETNEDVLSIAKKEKDLSTRPTKIADRGNEFDINSSKSNPKSEGTFGSGGLKGNPGLKKELEDMFYKMIVNPTINTKQANNWNNLYRRFVNENELKDLKVEKWNQEIRRKEIRD